MRVLVTGSSGFIGSALLRALAERGDEAVPVVRGSPRAGSTEVRWDPQAGTIDGRALEGCDAVVHLAGVGIGSRRWSARHKAAVMDSRVRGTDLLSRSIAALERPPAVLVSSSAIGFYGGRGTDQLTEESVGGGGYMASVCRRWEAATEPARAAGIRVANTRSGIVLHPSGGALQRQLLVFRLFAGGRIGSGKQYWSWISLRDEIRAVLHLVDGDLSGPVNLTAPEPVTNEEFTRALGRVLGRPTLLAVPGIAIRTAMGREMAEELLLASQRVLPVKLQNSGFRWEDPSLEDALRAMLDKGGRT